MPRGDKSKHTSKHHQAEPIEEGYKGEGDPGKEAESLAWAAMNMKLAGISKPGRSGRAKAEDHAPLHKAGRKGDAAAGRRPRAEPSTSGKSLKGTRVRRSKKG